MLNTLEFEKPEFTQIVKNFPQTFLYIKALRVEENMCLLNLAFGKDVFDILCTDFCKSIFFSCLFVMNALCASEGMMSMSTFICGYSKMGVTTLHDSYVRDICTFRFPVQWNPALRTPRYYGQFRWSRRKPHTFSLKLTRLIRTPINTDNGHFSVSRMTNSYTLSTPLYGHYLSVHCEFSLSRLFANLKTLDPGQIMI